MTGKILIYLGALLPFIWGVAHLFPTKSVVRGFGDISQDNKWVVSGLRITVITADRRPDTTYRQF